MKKNAIIRIVLYSILILLLAGLLIGALTVHYGFLPVIHWDHDADSISVITSSTTTPVSGFDGSSDVTAPTSSSSGTPAGLQLAHSGAVTPSDISDLEIDWASGTITIQPGDTDEITFSEPADAEESMAWYVADRTLFIRFSEDNLHFDYRPGKYHKDLTITVPKNWTASELTLNGASCRLEMSDLSILEELEINGASNRCVLSNCSVADVSINGASNNFSLEGTLTNFESDGVSTECTLKLTNHPTGIDMDGISSSLDLTIPEDCGFIVDSDGLSVKLDTDFPVTGGKNHFSYGDGSCQISIDGVSSDLSIRKAQ